MGFSLFLKLLLPLIKQDNAYLTRWFEHTFNLTQLAVIVVRGEKLGLVHTWQDNGLGFVGWGRVVALLFRGLFWQSFNWSH